jgi:hypothetical protein
VRYKKWPVYKRPIRSKLNHSQEQIRKSCMSPLQSESIMSSN